MIGIYHLFIFFSFFLSKILAQDTFEHECPIITTREDRRTDKNFLRLVQYNVEWLFVDHYNQFDCPGAKCTWKNITHAQQHLTYVSNVVRELQPDIINFCEVEGCDELNMVIGNLDPSYKAYLKKGTDTGTGQNVGMITRIDPLIDLYRNENKVSYPIKGSNCGYSGPTSTTGVSKHYITEFSISGINIAFIATHLIAIPDDPPRCAQREGQAQVLQNVVYDYVNKGYEIILLGDMNDYDNEVMDLNNDKPLSRTLDFLKGLDGERKGQYELINVAVNIPQNERYSDWWDSDKNCATASQKDYSMIDHVLVSKNILSRVKNTYIYHGYSEHCDKINSDHFPVVVELYI
ncbi:MAG: endonuclease/exonuclease/phosphatase family protein [Candidatus Paceibacterota bacterium]